MYDPRFLPICKEDLDELGWDYVDVIIISADAYVDHPCFGHAVVARLFEHEGLRVAILPQPNCSGFYIYTVEPRYSYIIIYHKVSILLLSQKYILLNFPNR